MAIGVVDIFDQVVSHAERTGLFETVNSHEAKSAPSNGLHCEVWVDRLNPVPPGSGLTATTGVLILSVRLLTSMLAEPQDEIDPGLLSAADSLMAEYSGDFELGGKVRSIDLLGQTGTAMSLRCGYIDIDNKKFRVFEIALPLIINDIWDQEA